MNDHAPAVPIAVVGIGALLPGARDAEQSWRMILGRRDHITEVPADRWLAEDLLAPDQPDGAYIARGGFLPQVGFDPMAHGMPPQSLPATDSAHLLSLLVAEQVLRDACGGQLEGLDRDTVSVILGVTGYLPLAVHMAMRTARPIWLKAFREAGLAESRAQELCGRILEHMVPWQEDTFPGLLPNVTAGRIANRFDLHGANHTTDAACASSFAALTTAVDALSLKRCDLALTGGTDTVNDELMFTCFSQTPALSPSGDCRPFSDHADGTLLGEGVVMFALKRLTDAERDADQVYAVIRGIGASSDGRGNAIYAPLPAGQERALRRAYEAAGYGPESVELLEAHGTGTKAGDRAEFAALSSVFGAAGRSGDPWCALGSIKSQIGHTKGAAGAAGLLKAVLALHHRVLPPTIKVDRPNPDLALATSPFYLNTRARPWVGAGGPRRASVSSFGFGGTNFHVAVEEFIPSEEGSARPARRLRSASAELILFSAATLDELREQVTQAKKSPLSELARTSQTRFEAGALHRLALVVEDPGELASRLDQATGLLSEAGDDGFSTPDGTYYAHGTADRGSLAFLFPGQGAQYVGMGCELATQHPAAQHVWEQAGALDFGVQPLHHMVFPPPAFSDEERGAQQARLTATEWAQPALAAHSLAVLALLNELGLKADCVAGHSFGELIALHAAGSFDAETLMRLARRRGELMRDAASTPSGMLAVSASRARTEAFLESAGGDQAWVANDNALEQTVLSGTVEALDTLAVDLADAGITAKRLQASAAFHSPLVASACAPLAEFLAQCSIEAPAMDVYANADATRYHSDPDAVRGRISQHLSMPVRFLEQIESMYEAGVRTFVEVGPARTLTGLVGRILRERPHLAVATDARGMDATVALFKALAQLAVHGVELDWQAHWLPYGPPRQAAAEPGLSIGVDGGNQGRPYPPAGGATALPAPNPEGPAVGRQESVESDGMPTGHPQQHLHDEAQRRAADAHADYQRYMTEAHLAFLRLTQESLAERRERPEGAARVEERPAALPAAAPPPAAAPSAPAQAGPSAPAPVPLPARPADAAPDTGAPADGTPVQEAVLSAVSERTGFPKELLNLDMELEKELGIDSIKRVEIMSMLRSKLGELGATAEELASCRTLQQIVDRLQGNFR
ncbi:beta-ketoacyl synthase N-terminal-like domain-containing protein [Streptomyces sp. NPDC051214]|uniref:type I polyketide synthase n=1 Tax=Streptomyces sp. NPDC051214 TaxID=3155282 RepID=UPI0034220C13